jgi:hypothetical protein
VSKVDMVEVCTTWYSEGRGGEERRGEEIQGKDGEVWVWINEERINQSNIKFYSHKWDKLAK